MINLKTEDLLSLIRSRDILIEDLEKRLIELENFKVEVEKALK